MISAFDVETRRMVIVRKPHGKMWDKFYQEYRGKKIWLYVSDDSVLWNVTNNDFWARLTNFDRKAFEHDDKYSSAVRVRVIQHLVPQTEVVDELFTRGEKESDSKKGSDAKKRKDSEKIEGKRSADSRKVQAQKRASPSTRMQQAIDKIKDQLALLSPPPNAQKFTSCPPAPNTEKLTPCAVYMLIIQMVKQGYVDAISRFKEVPYAYYDTLHDRYVTDELLVTQLDKLGAESKPFIMKINGMEMHFVKKGLSRMPLTNNMWLMTNVLFGTAPIRIDHEELSRLENMCDWNVAQSQVLCPLLDELATVFASIGSGFAFHGSELWCKPIKLHAFLARARTYDSMRLVVHGSTSNGYEQLRVDPLGCDLRYAGTRTGAAYGVAIYFGLSDHITHYFKYNAVGKPGTCMLSLLLSHEEDKTDKHKCVEHIEMEKACDDCDLLKSYSLTSSLLTHKTGRGVCNVVACRCNMRYLPLGFIQAA